LDGLPPASAELLLDGLCKRERESVFLTRRREDAKKEKTQIVR
jgi:hypothetical protein